MSIMEILTVRPQTMTKADWKSHQREQKRYIKRKTWGVLVWASNGVRAPLDSTFVKKFLINPMGTYRKGMQLLTD